MRSDPAGGAGFSFIELLLVAVIIAALAALAAPRMRAAYARYELEDFVRSLYNCANYLQMSAVSQGRIYCLEVDPDSHVLRPAYKEKDGLVNVSGRPAASLSPPPGADMLCARTMFCFYPDSSTDEGRIDFENKPYCRASIIFQGASGEIRIE